LKQQSEIDFQKFVWCLLNKCNKCKYTVSAAYQSCWWWWYNYNADLNFPDTW